MAIDGSRGYDYDKWSSPWSSWSLLAAIHLFRRNCVSRSDIAAKLPFLVHFTKKTFFKETGPSTTPYRLYSKNCVMHGYLILFQQRVVMCSASALLAVQFQCQRPDLQALRNCCATSGMVKHSACTRAAREWCRFLRYLWWFSPPTLRASDINLQRRNFRETSDFNVSPLEKWEKKSWAKVAPLNLKYPVPAEWQ